MGNICSLCIDNKDNTIKKNVFLNNKVKKKRTRKSTATYKVNENIENLLTKTPLIVEHDRSYSY
jgi:hypothetical protein